MKRLLILLLCTFIIFPILLLSGCQKKNQASIYNTEKLKKIALPLSKEDSVDLSLYFDSSINGSKVGLEKEVRSISKEDVIGELLIQELLKGPYIQSNLKPILPKETKLLSFSIKDKIAYVNLSKEAKVPMKPEQEEAALRSITTTLTQVSTIKKVKILIDNKDVDSLGGNYTIIKPIGKDDSYEKTK
jgi:germination protein M